MTATVLSPRTGATAPAPTYNTGNSQLDRYLTRKQARSQQAFENSADGQATLAAAIEEKRYQDMYRPLNQELMASLNDQSYVTKAENSLARDPVKMAARRQRELGRYGVQATALDTARADELSSLNDATDATFTMDKARKTQFVRNELMSNELMNIGRGMSKSGQSSLDQAAANETARNNANKMADAQQDAARTQMMGQVAAVALMAVMMM